MKKKFKKELKRQLRMAIAAAIGFLIAFSWRNTIYNLTRKYVEEFTNLAVTTNTELFTSILLTIIGVILILISVKLLKE